MQALVGKKSNERMYIETFKVWLTTFIRNIEHSRKRKIMENKKKKLINDVWAIE